MAASEGRLTIGVLDGRDTVNSRTGTRERWQPRGSSQHQAWVHPAGPSGRSWLQVTPPTGTPGQEGSAGLPNLKPHIGLVGRELRKTKMWLFFCSSRTQKQERRPRRGTSHRWPLCLGTLMGFSKNVEADMLSQWEVQSGGWKWGYGGQLLWGMRGPPGWDRGGLSFFSGFCLCLPIFSLFQPI